ncbi:hypothetical protein ACFYWX_16060 [Streptomyces sp. NPDC002888]|uniref:hypothetical protein n=1 Tax=Streptomyces sp. NPDC002888 TaxID=3364668 RepID=UPI0036A4AEF4
MAAWWARAIRMYPSGFRDAGEDVRTTLLAALFATRQAEITDALVELLVLWSTRSTPVPSVGWSGS